MNITIIMIRNQFQFDKIYAVNTFNKFKLFNEGRSNK